MNLKQNTFAVACIIGVTGFLWFTIPVISELNNWAMWDQPATVAKLIKALVFGLIAFLTALGVNVREFLGQFIPSFNPQVSQSKIDELKSKDEQVGV